MSWPAIERQMFLLCCKEKGLGYPSRLNQARGGGRLSTRHEHLSARSSSDARQDQPRRHRAPRRADDARG
jgi:hypothetical protein